MKSCDTFTVPRRAQAAGRIYQWKRGLEMGRVSITCRVTTAAVPMSALGRGRVKTFRRGRRAAKTSSRTPRQAQLSMFLQLGHAQIFFGPRPLIFFLEIKEFKRCPGRS